MGKYALIQNEQIPLHSGLNGRDLLEEVIPEAKKAGIKVIAYVPVSHGLPESLISDLHREALRNVRDDQTALTNVLNNAATAVVMAPLASELAFSLQVNPDPFLMGVAVAASTTAAIRSKPGGTVSSDCVCVWHG